jgi:8-oxo-dGTP diphosphatase
LIGILIKMNDATKVTKVGVGLVLLDQGRVLLGKRISSHGVGSYAGPGGGVGYMESPKSAIIRELREECGTDITISEPQFLCVVHWEEYAPVHYIGIGFVANLVSGNPRVVENDKIESWDWYDLSGLPQPLFGVMEHYIQALHTSRQYIEA